MQDLINKSLFVLKIILLLIAFSITLYILLLKMDYYGNNILSIIPLFIPLFLVLVIMVVSFFMNIGNKNIFFNISSFLSLVAIIIIDFRTLFDKNIINNYGAVVNFTFFDMQSAKLMFMLYLVFICNLLLCYSDKKDKIHS